MKPYQLRFTPYEQQNHVLNQYSSNEFDYQPGQKKCQQSLEPDRSDLSQFIRYIQMEQPQSLESQVWRTNQYSSFYSGDNNAYSLIIKCWELSSSTMFILLVFIWFFSRIKIMLGQTAVSSMAYTATYNKDRDAIFSL